MEKSQYAVEYELLIVADGLFSNKQIKTSGIEIVEAESPLDAQEVMGGKVKKMLARFPSDTSVLPAIKSIKKLVI
jgi:hypothetical protein